MNHIKFNALEIRLQDGNTKKPYAESSQGCRFGMQTLSFFRKRPRSGRDSNFALLSSSYFGLSSGCKNNILSTFADCENCTNVVFLLQCSCPTKTSKYSYSKSQVVATHSVMTWLSICLRWAPIAHSAIHFSYLFLPHTESRNETKKCYPQRNCL